MSFSRVTAPRPILDLAAVKQHLSVSFDDHDALIDALIEAATSSIDGPESWLGRCLGPQTWDWRIDAHELPPGCGWPWQRLDNFNALVLPVRPVISVDEIEYVDVHGATQPWTAWQAFGLGSVGAARLAPVTGGSWPLVETRPEAVRIRLTAGYGKSNGESPEAIVEAVPYAIKVALMLMIGDLYAHRQTAVIGQASAVPMSPSVDALLAPFRAWP